DAYAVEPHALAAFIRSTAASGMRGLNVTIPHKEAALAWCEPDALARRVGAVNTLLFERDRIHGVNTDVYGVQALFRASGAYAGGRVVLLGAGGAARAVVVALREAGAELVVVSRRAAPLVVDGQECTMEQWQPDALAALFNRADLVIDATPRGLDPALSP